MKSSTELRTMIQALDRKSYPAYKTLQGQYQFPDYILSIDHVQGDPFASPSKLSILISNQIAKFPESFFDSSYKRTALQDFLTRQFYHAILNTSDSLKASKKETMDHKNLPISNYEKIGSGKSGLLYISHCGQEILERTSCSIRSGIITIRLEAGFPAFGRTIYAQGLIELLFRRLPAIIHSSLFYQTIDSNRLKEVILLSEDQNYIRSVLDSFGLIAFVANHSILPRESGVSDKPLRQAVPFLSPSSLEVTLRLPNHGLLKGMGIKKGVTLIIGGGYHGKSTLLKALEVGVYNHIPGDGREFVITESSAVKLRAEDGRCVKKVNISMFINHLPMKKDTSSFSTADASGSTSQAAAVIEGMEADTKLFLMDEDTSATNFMLRDPLMQQVVTKEKEPITSFLERVRALYHDYGISTILAAGSSGAFFSVADTILQMDSYIPYDITTKAKEACAVFPNPISADTISSFKPILLKQSFSQRIPQKSSKRERTKIKLSGKDRVQINHEIIDLRYVEQLVDEEQIMALGYIVNYLQTHLIDGRKSLSQLVDELLGLLDKKELSILSDTSYLPAFLALPRKQDILACLNRYRDLQL